MVSLLFFYFLFLFLYHMAEVIKSFAGIQTYINIFTDTDLYNSTFIQIYSNSTNDINNVKHHLATMYTSVNWYE